MDGPNVVFDEEQWERGSIKPTPYQGLAGFLIKKKIATNSKSAERLLLWTAIGAVAIGIIVWFWFNPKPPPPSIEINTPEHPPASASMR
ncbi:MAG: hypothetical protein JO026_00730 [Patescibacteria group bacterium]|nr:hypothetical protein [Patescibacteria group bacterium]